jgi:Fic family protein
MRSATLDLAAMEPLLPDSAGLAEPAMALLREASALGGRLHPITRRSVAELLRTINTYHSNLIEGHDTHPRDIERALEGRLSTAPARRALQLEARAHIEVQRVVEHRMEADGTLDITSTNFLLFLHREFYERMPDEWRKVRSGDGTRERTVVPGRLRDEEVDVGRHVPPPPSSLPRLLERFSEAYDPGRLTGLDAVIAIAASHHRLLWIHPFIDGNGRVARLFTDAYLRRVGVGGHGLWTASRGFARHRARYFDALAAADAERRNDYDGRGARSHAALAAFCEFFLETCLDQVRFMSRLLELDDLLARTEHYAARRAAGGMGARLAPQAALLLREALLRGEFPRGDAPRITGTSERTARRILGTLVGERLLASDTPKGPVRLGLPVHAVGFYFPQLFPEGALDCPSPLVDPGDRYRPV